MKIARLLDGNNETYGFIKGDKVSTKDEITYLTGVPIPQNVRDFLFDGWYDEIKSKIDDLPYGENISKFVKICEHMSKNHIYHRNFTLLTYFRIEIFILFWQRRPIFSLIFIKYEKII